MGTLIPWVNPSSLVGGVQGPLSLGGSSLLARNGIGKMETKYSTKGHLRSNELVPSANIWSEIVVALELMLVTKIWLSLHLSNNVKLEA